MLPSPQINCRELPFFDTSSLDSVRTAFQNSTACALRQAWLPKPEAGFAPALAHVGWRTGSLLLYVDLTDTDIFTRATADNQHFWELGDTFEIFLRPVEQELYLEFHVTPNNLHLQLRFANAETTKRIRKTGAFESVIINEPVFESKTWVHPNAGRWFIYAEIPVISVMEKPAPLPGSKWLFSFSRYEYARGRKEPVISSTSPHSVPDFHCQEEWGMMQFKL